MHFQKYVGTCIGERNHCRFWWFLTAQVAGFGACVNIVGGSRVGIKMGLNYLLGLSTTAASSSSMNLSAANALVVITAKLYLYPLTFFAVLMWLSHTFFALGNLTTYECGKGPQKIDYLSATKEMDLPFSRGCVSNTRIFCCYRDATATLWLCMSSLLKYGGNEGVELLQKSRRQINDYGWTPILWRPPGKIDRDSENVWDNLWENKYWSCC